MAAFQFETQDLGRPFSIPQHFLDAQGPIDFVVQHDRGVIEPDEALRLLENHLEHVVERIGKSDPADRIV